MGSHYEAPIRRPLVINFFAINVIRFISIPICKSTVESTPLTVGAVVSITSASLAPREFVEVKELRKYYQ